MQPALVGLYRWSTIRCILQLLELGNALENNALQVRNCGRGSVSRLLQPQELRTKFREGIVNTPTSRIVELRHWLPQEVMVVLWENSRARFSARSREATRRRKSCLDSKGFEVPSPLRRTPMSLRTSGETIRLLDGGCFFIWRNQNRPIRTELAVSRITIGRGSLARACSSAQ